MHHPLRLLLYIEWILFAVVMTLEVSPHEAQLLEPQWINIGVVLVLAVMGLRLPAGKLPIKLLYTIAQIMPILVAASVGMRTIPWLFTIVVIRSYLIFGRRYRLWIIGASVVFMVYVMATTLFMQHPHPHPGSGFHSQRHSPTVVNRSSAERHRQRDGFRWGFVLLLVASYSACNY